MIETIREPELGRNPGVALLRIEEGWFLGSAERCLRPRDIGSLLSLRIAAISEIEEVDRESRKDRGRVGATGDVPPVASL